LTHRRVKIVTRNALGDSISVFRYLLPTKKSFLQQVLSVGGASPHAVGKAKQKWLMSREGLQPIVCAWIRRASLERNCHFGRRPQPGSVPYYIFSRTSMHTPLDSRCQATFQDSVDFIETQAPAVDREHLPDDKTG
jgi:hypothetical protein